MSGARALAKEVVERLIGSKLGLAVGLRWQRGARLTLAYHNVVAHSAPLRGGDASLHLPFSSFCAQLDALQDAGVAVVAVDAPAEGVGVSPTAVITFDDAYAGALDLAIPELARRGLPATVFVAPGLLGADAAWWDRLGDPAQGSVPEQVRESALRELRGEGARILAEARGRGWTVFPALPEHRIGHEDGLARALALHPGLTLGVHTWSHPNLAAITPAAATEEVARALEWLEARFPERTLRWLAYPYGLDSESARNAAQLAGLQDALLVLGGWDRGASPRLRRPRLNVTAGLSIAGFRMRLAGLKS